MMPRNYTIETVEQFIDIDEIVEILANWAVREIEKEQRENNLDNECEKVLICTTNDYKRE